MAKTATFILGIVIATTAQANKIQLQGDSAIYNRQQNTLILDKNASAKNAEGVVTSNKIIYNQNTDIVTATGNAYFISSNVDRPITLNADTLIYNQKNSVLTLKTNAQAQNNTVILQSTYVTYDGKNNMLTTQGNTVFTSKTDTIVLRGENATYDGTQQLLQLYKNAQAENEHAVLQSNALLYNQKSQVIETTGNTVFRAKNSPIILQGEDAVYDRNAQTLVLNKNAQAENETALLQSNRLSYDQINDVINTTDNTVFTSKSDATVLKGNQAVYDRKQQFIVLDKGASAENADSLLTADKITYDQNTNIMDAKGKVYYSNKDINTKNRLTLAGNIAQYNGNMRTLIVQDNTRAKGAKGEMTSDSIVYDESTDLVQAAGNVQYKDTQGNISTMDTLKSNIAFDTMSGTNIQRTLQNNVLVSAQVFKTYPNGNMEVEKGTYTSCLVPEGETIPTWLLRAENVTLDAEDENIVFTNSRMELAGVPVYYWPYLEQPTPDVIKRDGWLIPDIGTTSTIGLFVKAHYYQSNSDNSDMIVTPIYTTRRGQGLEISYRKNGNNSITRNNISVMQDTDVDVEDSAQGHWFASYVKNASNGWQYKLDHQNVTEKSYFKTYTLLNKAIQDNLRSGATATKINQSSVLAIDTASYRDVRQDAQPVTTLLPSIQYEKAFQSANGNNNINIKTIVRSMQKRGLLKSHTASTTVTYSRPFVSKQGLVIKTDISGRGDAYNYRYYKSTIIDGRDRTIGTLNRFTPMASVVVSYPLIVENQYNVPKNRQVILEPVAGVFISQPKENPDWLPNNDTVDFELDESNLFSNNRYAGVDKIDTGHRYSYGSRLKIWQDDAYIQAFLGQNITRAVQNPLSDFIGSLYAKWQNIDMYANFELDSDDFSTRKIESNVEYIREKYTLSGGYTKINPRETSQLQSIAQTKMGVAYHINTRWRLTTEHSYEFEESKKGLIRQSLGLEYNTDCGCFAASLQYKQDYSKSRSTPDKSLFIQMKFREVGNFQEQF